MAEPLELPRPEMRAGTSFHADHARWESSNDAEQFLPGDLRLRHNRLAGFIDRVDSENLLGQTDASSHMDFATLESERDES